MKLWRAMAVAAILLALHASALAGSNASTAVAAPICRAQRFNGRMYNWLDKVRHRLTCTSMDDIESHLLRAKNVNVTAVINPGTFDASQAALGATERDPKFAFSVRMAEAEEAGKAFRQNGALPFSIGHHDVHRARLRVLAREAVSRPLDHVLREGRFSTVLPWHVLPKDTRDFFAPPEVRAVLRYYFQAEPLLVSAENLMTGSWVVVVISDPGVWDASDVFFCFAAGSSGNTTQSRQVQLAHTDNSLPPFKFVNQLCSFSAAGVAGTWHIPGSHSKNLSWIAPALSKRVTRTHNCVFVDGSTVHFGGANKNSFLDYKLVLLWASATTYADREEWTTLLEDSFFTHPDSPKSPDPVRLQTLSALFEPTAV